MIFYQKKISFVIELFLTIESLKHFPIKLLSQML
jgi:hypothetical protein